MYGGAALTALAALSVSHPAGLRTVPGPPVHSRAARSRRCRTANWWRRFRISAVFHVSSRRDSRSQAATCVSADHRHRRLGDHLRRGARISHSDTGGHSLQQLAVMTTNRNFIVEVGWTVDNSLNGEYRPHLFVYTG